MVVVNLERQTETIKSNFPTQTKEHSSSHKEKGNQQVTHGARGTPLDITHQALHLPSCSLGDAWLGTGVQLPRFRGFLHDNQGSPEHITTDRAQCPGT